MYLTIMDDTGSCCLLIILSNGPRYKVLGDNFFSVYWSSATTWNISDTIFFFFLNWRIGTPKTHITQTGSSRIFKCMVLVDNELKKKYREIFLLHFQQLLCVFYCRCLNLCTALSTSLPGHPGLTPATCICVVSHLQVELSILFLLGLWR